QSKTATESGAPYALYGDNAGNYNAWTPALGSYTLKGTPYTGSGGSGTAGSFLSVGFTVVNNTAAATTARSREGAAGTEARRVGGLQVTAYPNPTPGRISLRFSEPVDGSISYSLYAANGKRLLAARQALPQPVREVGIDLGAYGLANGVYYLAVESRQRRRTLRIVIGDR
ncbi:MAG: T9SS type A sorting domain-containing protein, partial [Chitinophagaceae bacterium]